MKWIPLWHQAMTMSLFDGRLTGKNKTVFFRVHTPVNGNRLRIRFSNLYGKKDTVIDSAAVFVNGKRCAVTMENRMSITIPKGTQKYSDPLPVPVSAGAEITFAMYWNEYIIDGNAIEEEADLYTGNRTQKEMTFTVPHRRLINRLLGAYTIIPAIDLIEIETEETVKNIVAFGDSITAMSRWTKPLQKRLEETYGGRYILLNSGISGNCLLYKTEGITSDLFGEPGIIRFDRDVLSLDNVHAVIIAIGVNDVSYYTEKTKDIINLESYQKAVTELTERLHEKKIRVIMSTITPRLKCDPKMGVFTAEMEQERLRINEWIRTAGIFDMVIDAEAAVRNHDDQGMFFREDLHQGDHLHPNAEGGRVMAEAYDLEKLTGEQNS